VTTVAAALAGDGPLADAAVAIEQGERAAAARRGALAFELRAQHVPTGWQGRIGGDGEALDAQEIVDEGRTPAVDEQAVAGGASAMGHHHEAIAVEVQRARR